MLDLDGWRIEAPDGSISIQDYRVRWVHADRTMVRYVAKKIEVSGDFRQSFMVCVEEGYVEDQENRGLIRLWELRNDWNNRVWVYVRKTDSGCSIHFEQRDNADNLWAYHGSYVFPFGQRVNILLERRSDTYRLRARGADNDVIIEDSGWIEGINQVYEWLWLASTIKSRRNNNNWSTGYIEDLNTSSND